MFVIYTLGLHTQQYLFNNDHQKKHIFLNKYDIKIIYIIHCFTLYYIYINYCIKVCDVTILYDSPFFLDIIILCFTFFLYLWVVTHLNISTFQQTYLQLRIFKLIWIHWMKKSNTLKRMHNTCCFSELHIYKLILAKSNLSYFYIPKFNFD